MKFLEIHHKQKEEQYFYVFRYFVGIDGMYFSTDVIVVYESVKKIFVFELYR